MSQNLEVQFDHSRCLRNSWYVDSLVCPPEAFRFTPFHIFPASSFSSHPPHQLTYQSKFCCYKTSQAGLNSSLAHLRDIHSIRSSSNITSCMTLFEIFSPRWNSPLSYFVYPSISYIFPWEHSWSLIYLMCFYLYWIAGFLKARPMSDSFLYL